MKNKIFDIAQRYKLFLIIPAVLVLISISGIIINGLNWGIDFVGGSIAQFELNTTFSTEQIKTITDKYDQNAIITSAGDENTQVIIKSTISFDENTKNAMIDDFENNFNITSEEVLSFDSVSPTIGKELQLQALQASLITIVCILIYITIRFEFLSGIAAIIALLHDIIIVIGFYAIFKRPVNSSFIAAILTILGYSINSSIVVFDRVRDRKKRHGRYEFDQLINDSLVSSCKRTLYSTITTLLAVISLYIFGVTSIKEFTLPMIIGFICGAYSSLFICGSFWYAVKNNNYMKKQAKLKNS